MGAKSVRLPWLSFVFLFVACVSVAQPIDYRISANLERLVAQHSVPYLLIDVRTPAEYRSGHIPTAINIPYDTVAARIAGVPKGSLIIVYCASGGRASIAAKTLEGLGFTDVTDFGALSNWKGPIVTDSE